MPAAVDAAAADFLFLSEEASGLDGAAIGAAAAAAATVAVEPVEVLDWTA